MMRHGGDSKIDSGNLVGGEYQNNLERMYLLLSTTQINYFPLNSPIYRTNPLKPLHPRVSMSNIFI